MCLTKLAAALGTGACGSAAAGSGGSSGGGGRRSSAPSGGDADETDTEDYEDEEEVRQVHCQAPEGPKLHTASPGKLCCGPLGAALA